MRDISGMNREDRRIAMFCSSPALGGLELNMVKLAGALLERDWPVTMILRDASPMAEHAAARGLTCIGLGLETRRGCFPASGALRHALQHAGVALLLTGDNRDLPVAALAVRRTRPPVPLVHLQQMQFGGSKRDPYHWLLYSRTAAWVLPLQGMKQQALSMTRLPAARMHVVPYGIDRAPYLAAQPDRLHARAALGVPEECFLIGTIGRFDRGKGQEHLVAAMTAPQLDGLPVHALLVGDDTRAEEQHYAAYVRENAVKAGIAQRVHIRAFMPEPAIAFRALDIFVLTSLRETYGLVTLEAMASGLPIIATATGGTAEILTHRKTGLLVPPADPRAIAAAVRELHDNPSLAAMLGSAAREESARYSLERQCEGMEALFVQLASSNPR